MNLDSLKRQARDLKRATGKSHSQCLEELARQHGFKTYAALLASTSQGKKEHPCK